MRRLRYIALFIVVFVLTTGGTQLAQEQATDESEPVRNIAFIQAGRRNLDTAATSDIGADGLTRLVEQFVRLGGQVIDIELDSAIPEDIELVVLIRPRRGLNALQTAYLWQFLQRGGHLLLAFDPDGHNGVRGEGSRGGISTLLNLETGLGLNDNLLIEPWLDMVALSDVVTSWADAEAEPFQPHPITDPLLLYDLPLRYWGGRSLNVAGITGTSQTNALIVTERPFGESGRIRLNPEEPTPFTLDIGADEQGRLVLGAIATYDLTGSRVALFGDSEIFLNIYGQTRNAVDEAEPGLPGNFVFTQRLLAWLMGIPEADWPELPAGFTWLQLDGAPEADPSEWPSRTVEHIATREDDAPDNAITRVQAFHNDRFAYLAIETGDISATDARFRLQYEGDITLLLTDGVVSQINPDGTLSPVLDAEYAAGARLEARLPRRVVGDTPVLMGICVLDAAGTPESCFEQRMNSGPVTDIDPVPMRFEAVPSAFTVNTANMRNGPSTEALRLAQFPPRASLAVVGRTEDSEWIQVQDGRFKGWIAVFLLAINTDIASLPVIELAADTP